MKIFPTQIEAQRFLLRMVPQGFRWWQSGICDIAKLEHLSVKFEEHYGTELTPRQRSYRRSKGLANAWFIACPLPAGEGEGLYIWYLIATDGKGPIRDNKKLKDARANAGRITWGDYVLYEAPRHRLEGGGTRWSWYLQPKVQKEIDHHVGVLLKQSPESLAAFLEMEVRRPMHHGIRQFLRRLIRRAHQNYCRMYPGRDWKGRDPARPLPIITSYKSLPS